jgi:hypothetical protein
MLIKRITLGIITSVSLFSVVALAQQPSSQNRRGDCIYLFMWGAQPHKGLIYFNDINSGLWIVKLGDKINKGSTTSPGQ